LVLSEFENLFKLSIEGLFDASHHVLHHQNLVSFGIVTEQLEGIVKEGPLLFVENLFCLLCLHCHLLFFLLLSLLFLFLLFFSGSHDQRLNHTSIHHVFIAIGLITALRISSFLLFLLSTTQIEQYLQCSLLLFTQFSQLVIEDHEIILEAVDRLQLHLHPIPCYLLQLSCKDLVSQYLYTTFLSDLKTFSKDIKKSTLCPLLPPSRAIRDR
jgi:hypothetical protein